MTSPEERQDERESDLLAKLFDIRSFTGFLFVIFGVIVTIVGLTATEADIQKAAGINLSLIIGILMLVVGVIFLTWLMLRPPEILHGHEVTEDDLPEQLRHHGLEAIPEHQQRPPRAGPPGH